MPKMVPTTASIVVVRTPEGAEKGRRVPVPVNKPFNFTAEEVEYINRVHPGALRKPVNESAVDEEEGHDSDDSGAAGTDAKATATKGAKPKAKGKTPKGKEAPAPKEIADDADEDDSNDDDDDSSNEDEDI